MAFQLALGCNPSGYGSVHRRCCCCSGLCEVVISGVASGIICLGQGEDSSYNGTNQVACPNLLQTGCSIGGGFQNSHVLRITVSKFSVLVTMQSDYYYFNTSPFPSGLLEEHAMQFRRLEFDLSNCPNSGDFLSLSSDTFRTLYESVYYTPGSCTPAGPTVTTNTYGSITQTITTSSTCPGAGQRDNYSSDMAGTIADLLTYSPGTLVGIDYWIWLGNLRNAIVSAQWI